MDKIIILVSSARKHFRRRQAIRQTWMHLDIPQGIIVKFVIANKGADPVEPMDDILLVDHQEEKKNLSDKMVEAFKVCLRDYDFEWIFRVDDDTFVLPDRVRSPLSDDKDVIGDGAIRNKKFANGGAGFYLRRNIVQSIVNAPPAPGSKEDEVISMLAISLAGIRVGVSPLLINNTYRRPEYHNSYVTCHLCAPYKMREVYENYKAGMTIAKFKEKQTQA